MSVRFTIEVDDDVAERIVAAAAERGITPEELLAEVLTELYGPRRQVGIASLGHSGRGDLSGRVKELRRKAFVNKTAAEA